MWPLPIQSSNLDGNQPTDPGGPQEIAQWPCTKLGISRCDPSNDKIIVVEDELLVIVVDTRYQFPGECVASVASRHVMNDHLAGIALSVLPHQPDCGAVSSFHLLHNPRRTHEADS